MKKKFFGILSLMMAVSLLACGNDEPLPKENSSQKQETVQQENIQQNKVDPSLIGKSFASGDYEYTVQEDGNIYISGYTGSEANLILPKEIDGYSVKGISEEAFRNSESIVTLVIPGNIEEICKKAFSGCINLKKLTLEEGVKIIAYRAFQNGPDNNSTIEEISIPDSIMEMGDHPFGLTNSVSRNSNGLLYIGKFVVDFAEDFNGNVIFEEGTLGIADKAFILSGFGDWKIKDTTLEIPDGVRYIGSAAFAGQDDINYFKVPASVKIIGQCAMHYDYVNYGCELYQTLDTRKIYGKSGSIAEQYAASNGINFVIVN